MKQWNIDLTLSKVSVICSEKLISITSVDASGPDRLTHVSTSPRAFSMLCRLVETVVKHHRKRLDGHFHLLITALRFLLESLLSRRPSASGYSGASAATKREAEQYEKQAKQFSGLITLVCEPSVASVSRSASAATSAGGSNGPNGGGGGGGVLDSEKDKAKRYAGQYMYLVLVAYVKLQLEHAMPHHVREVLETGMYSILNITNRDGMQIVNDSMDQGGRVIFKELYKRYKNFGKWSGV